MEFDITYDARARRGFESDVRDGMKERDRLMRDISIYESVVCAVECMSRRLSWLYNIMYFGIVLFFFLILL